jgi:hypothetical protein
MIAAIFDFLKRHDPNLQTHVVIISQDTDFYLLLNKLKRFPRIKTHLMTSVDQQPFIHGLADVVVFYEKAFGNAQLPKKRKNREPSPFTPSKKSKSE